MENGTWTEMVGRVTRKEADMTIVPLYITLDRYSAVEFSTSIAFQSTVFIVKAPEMISNWKSIVAPFSFMIWIFIIVTVIVFGLVLHKVIERDLTAQDIQVYWPRHKVFWNLFCTFLYKGMNLNSIKKFRSRFLIGIWWLSILVLVSSYSGTLMSFMTYPLHKPVPKTFDELAAFVIKGEYSCGTSGKSALWLSILNSKLKTAEILRDNIIRNDNFLEASRAMERVEQEHFAFIQNSYLVRKLIRKEDLHKYVISSDSFAVFSEAYGMKKNFSYSKK
ncbi:glutamate receptor ionotropic, delta-2-like, partial [Centruroides sculpturatus]|uniref:glutamate receptor ionotropic, delta-2-like n=1 Tax=Centruroides sculpturatus TaxID=218467 RepID=UPI000C6E03BF